MRRFQSKKKTVLPANEVLAIEKFSHDGRGVARSNGKVVLVAGALAGERCEVRYEQANSKLHQGVAKKIIQASDQRVTPPCSLYGQCGGCQQQHISHQAQLALKQQTIAEQFSRQGVQHPELEAPVVSKSFAYRHRARLHLSKNGQMGFHGQRNNQVVAVDQCPVFTGELQTAYDHLRDSAPLLGVQQLELVVDDVGKIGLAVIKASPNAKAELLQWAQAQQWVVDQPLTYASGEAQVYAQPGDFTQVNRAVNQAMQQRLVQWLQLEAKDRLMDLFCGNGNLSIGLCAQVAAVLGYESNAHAIAQATSVAPENAQFRVKNLFTEDLQDDEIAVSFDPTVAVIDPPRAGAERLCQSISTLSQLRKLVYISCDPATLARDLHSLQCDNWHLRKVALVDMFPQTRHIETMVLLEK